MSIIPELFNTYPLFYLTTVFVLGLTVGSFINVVISRLPVMMEKEWRDQCCDLLEIENNNQATRYNLVTPRSHCPKCNHPIGAMENIPIISYVLLNGKCRNCRGGISIRYPVVEFISGLTVTIVAFYYGVTMQALFAMSLTWALIALSMIDLEHRLLPDEITLPFLWLGIGLNIFNTFTDLQSSVLGAVFGYGSLWSVYIVYKLITKKEGMGHGDFKLLAMLGAWFGWQLLPLIIILSSFVGAVTGIFLVVFKSHDRAVPIPFGPYLTIAGWISMLWGAYIMSAYLNTII